MKFTKDQIAHLRTRLDQAAEKRVARASQHIGEKPTIPTLTFGAKCDLIRAGKAKLKPQPELSSYTDLEDAYIYPTHDKDAAAAKKKLTAWEASRQKIRDQINAERDRVLDKIMLGVSEDALAAIDRFAAGNAAQVPA